MILNARIINGLGVGIHTEPILCIDEDEEPFECPCIYVTLLCFEVAFILGVSQ